MPFSSLRLPVTACLLLYGSLSLAQITLTDAYFPQVGDSLLTDQAPEELLADIEFREPGADLTWDFGTPPVRFSYTEVIEGVTDDVQFPRATGRTTSAAFDYEYYQRTDTAFNLVGLVGRVPFFQQLPLSIALVPARPLRRAGITYGDRFETTSVRRTVLSTDSLPAEIRESDLGRTLLAFDSIKVESSSERIDRVDAYGTLRLNDFTYRVLREKRVEQMETRLFLKQAGGQFADVTALVLRIDPSYGQYLGTQPSEGTYFFWAREVKEPIVEIEFDDREQPKTLLFRRGGGGDLTATRGPVVRALGLSPNPVTAGFRLDFELQRSGRVEVRLSDAVGRSVRQWELGTLAGGRQTFRGSLAALPSGVYYVAVRTRGGVATQKVIRP